jgi:hypothetical protein
VLVAASLGGPLDVGLSAVAVGGWPRQAGKATSRRRPARQVASSQQVMVRT